MPFLIDRSTTSLVMLAARALSTAVRRRGLPLMAPPPVPSETVISLMIFVHTFDFLESEASFLCLIFDQRLCPDMGVSYHGPPGVGRVPAPADAITGRPSPGWQRLGGGSSSRPGRWHPRA